MTLSLFYHPIVGGHQQPLKWSLLHFPKKGTSRNARSKGLTNRVSLHRWEGIFEVQTHQEKAPRCWKFPEFVNFTWNKKFTFKSTIIYRWSTHVSCEVLYHTINSVDVLDVNDFIPKELSDFFPMYFFVRKKHQKTCWCCFPLHIKHKNKHLCRFHLTYESLHGSKVVFPTGAAHIICEDPGVFPYARLQRCQVLHRKWPVFNVQNTNGWSPWNLWYLLVNQGIVGCNPTNVPLWEIPN